MSLKANCHWDNMVEQLDGAPRDVMGAATRVFNSVNAGKTPDPELVAFVNKWLSRKTVQNRYGK